MSKELEREVNNEVVEVKEKWNMRRVGIIAGAMFLSFTVGFGVAKTKADNARTVSNVAASQNVQLSEAEKRDNLLTNTTSVYVMGKVMNDWLDVQAKYTSKYAPLSDDEILEIKGMIDGISKMCVSIARDVSRMESINDKFYYELNSQVIYMYMMPLNYLVDVVELEGGNKPELTDEDVAFIYELVTADRYDIERMDSKELKTYFDSVYTKRKERKKLDAQTSTFKN